MAIIKILNMKRYLIVFCLFFVSWFNWGQINSNFNWDSSTNISPWTSTGPLFNITSDLVCQGTKSIRVNLKGGQNDIAVFTSGNLTGSNEGLITLGFQYKWIVADPNLPGVPATAAPANELRMVWQWSNSTSGPWYTITTIDGNNHQASVNCANVTSSFAPYSGGVYVRLIAENVGNTSQNYLYLDDISITQGTAPTCKMPKDINITNKTSNSFRINWTASGQATTGYDWEVRTSGAPGSGNVGLVTSGSATGLFANATTGITPLTNYKVYVRAKCSSTDFSFWASTSDVFTFCASPTLTTTTSVSICGPQDKTLTVTTGNPNATTIWYDEKGVELDRGVNTFTTPVLTSTTKYRVITGLLNASNTIKIGTGLSLPTTAVPFYSTKAYKVQYIYQATELKAQGFNSGTILSFGFETGTNIGKAQRNNFTVHMGAVNYDDFPNANFIPTGNLTLVKDAGDQLLVASSLNKLVFDRGFQWDGVSNIVVQITYSDASGTSTVGTSSGYSGSNRTLYKSDTTKDLTGMYNEVSGTLSTNRLNGHFDILDGCFSEMRTITVNYNNPPELKLSTNSVNYCSSYPPQTVNIVSGANDYSNYEWSPNTDITGDEKIGWTFDPKVNTVYTLTATNNATNRCVNIQQVEVTLNPSPKMLQLDQGYNLCFNEVQELKAINLVNDTATKYLFNGDLNGVSIRNNAIGDGIFNEKNLFSEGNGSLKITYGSQTNALVNFDPSVNMFDLESIIVEFDHIAALQATKAEVLDYAYIEYSTNNGFSWKPLLKTDYVGSASTSLPAPKGTTGFQAMYFTQTSYSEWSNLKDVDLPVNSMWKTEKFVVPATEFTGRGDFKIRLRIGADGNTQYAGWFVDNVKITPVNTNKVIWTPITNLYLDKNTTIPYDGITNVGTVYLKGNTNNNQVPYNVEISNQFGCKVEHDFDVSIGLNQLPIVHTIESCGSINITDIDFKANKDGKLRYYATQNSNIDVSQITKSGIYYVDQEIFGCKSLRVPFTVIINTKAPIAVAPANQTFCGQATVNDLIFSPINGMQAKWYQTSTGGMELSNTTLLNNGVYYVEMDNGVCKSDNRISVNVTIGNKPASITMNDIYVCGLTTVDDINVSSLPGAAVNWYKNLNDPTPLAKTTVLATGIYYVAQKIAGCESDRLLVNVNVIQNLTSPSATAQVFCGGATVSDLMASGINGAEILWFGNSSSDIPLPVSTALSSGTYYVAQKIGDCISTKRGVSVRIISNNAPIISPVNLCGDVTVASLPLNVAPGTTYKVYNANSVELNQNDVIKTGTYYISKVESGCESQRATVQVTVTPRPNAPTGNTKQSFNDYAEVSNLKMNEAVIWFDSYNDAVNNANPLPAKTALQNNKTYYAVVEGPNGCTSLPTAVTVTIVLGLNDLDLASLKYYPNPADSELTVSYKEPIRSIEIYDILGKQIKVQKFETNEVRLDVSRLSSGTYMLKVQTDSGSQFVKIVKK